VKARVPLFYWGNTMQEYNKIYNDRLEVERRGENRVGYSAEVDPDNMNRISGKCEFCEGNPKNNSIAYSGFSGSFYNIPCSNCKRFFKMKRVMA